MTGEQATAAVIETLERLGLPYMAVGSLTTNFYGQPRGTKDADFVVELGSSSIGALASALGSGFHLDPQATFERVTGTTRYKLSAEGTPNSPLRYSF